MKYGLSRIVDLSYEQTVEKVTEELKKEGFGILTTINVKETLEKKLGINYKKYVILGACNPQFAHRALDLDEEMGLLLPCNVIVYEKDGKTALSIFDPMVMSSIVENDTMTPIAREVRGRLEKVIASV